MQSPSRFLELVALFAGLAACNSNASTPGAKPESPKSPAAAPAQAGPAPGKFVVKLETTKGDILIDVDRSLAPNGVDRFYELVKSGYYDEVAFFRVVAGFMAQVGIHGDPAMNTKWREARIPDDPPKESNKPGWISFAMGGPNTRTTQFFINLVDNGRLDSMGFAPFGKVRDMSVVEKLYSGYGEGAPGGKGPSQMLLQMRGNAYLKSDFPELDYIKKATIVE